jgi:hypothetical protein
MNNFVVEHGALAHGSVVSNLLSGELNNNDNLNIIQTI